jgi:hypothetical protein
MSLFQIVTTWLLRALLCWCMLETGLSLYEEATRQLDSWRRISGTNAAIARLNPEASTIQARASAREALAAATEGEAWRLERAADAPTLLREHLLMLGAQAPVVDLSEGAAGGAQSEVRLRARWREHADRSPEILAGLASRLTALRVANLSLARIDNELVAIEAEFVAVIRVQARAPP